MTSLLIKLYPARWRARYGDEFEAILEERPLGPFDVADILLGALDAHLHQRGQRTAITQERGFTMSLRIGGLAAIVAAALVSLALLLGTGALVRVDGVVLSLLLLVGSLALLVALAGLSAFQARIHPRMSWAAFWVLAAGTVAITVAILAQLAFDADGRGEYAGAELVYLAGLLGFGTAVVGSVMFGIVTYRTAVLSIRSALLLVAAPALLIIGFAVASTDSANGGSLGLVAFYPGIICFAAGWFALGLQAIQLDRTSPGFRPV